MPDSSVDSHTHSVQVSSTTAAGCTLFVIHYKAEHRKTIHLIGLLYRTGPRLQVNSLASGQLPDLLAIFLAFNTVDVTTSGAWSEISIRK